MKSTITYEANDGEGNLIGQITVPAPDIDPTLLWLLRRAGECWGALGVALAAATMTDSATLISRLTSDGARNPKPRPSR